MKKRLENYIEAAILLLPESGIVKNNIIENKYSGYISSFGAAVINNGFVPAYMFYNKDSDHNKLLTSILSIIKSTEESSSSNLLGYYNEKQKSEYALQKIMDAATALKLTIRTYKLEKSN